MDTTNHIDESRPIADNAPGVRTMGGQAGIVSRLRHYNRWRRGEHDDMPLPSDIGETLDHAAYRIEQLEQVIRAATVLIAAKGRHNTMLAYEGLRASLATVKETP